MPVQAGHCVPLLFLTTNGTSCPANETSDTLIPVQVADGICDACPANGTSCPANETSDTLIPVQVADGICVAKKTPKGMILPMTKPLDTTDKCLDPRPLRPMTNLAPLHPGTHPRRTTRTRGTNVRPTSIHHPRRTARTTRTSGTRICFGVADRRAQGGVGLRAEVDFTEERNFEVGLYLRRRWLFWNAKRRLRIRNCHRGTTQFSSRAGGKD